MDNIIYIILLAAGASFIQRTIGFGFGIFIMTALPFLLPSYAEAVTLSGLLSLTSATVVMLQYVEYVTWKRFLPILGAFVIFSTAAILMLDKIEGPMMRKILGTMLIFLSFYSVSSRKNFRSTSAPHQDGCSAQDQSAVSWEDCSVCRVRQWFFI